MIEADTPDIDLLEGSVEHRFADNGGVRIHYVVLGSGPLAILLHGFPDFWLTWHRQMVALSRHYRVAALDLRGYNLSDKPHGAESYALAQLMGDVMSVVADLGQARALLLGHDWGGVIAWHLAMEQPQIVERLVVLNMPHPSALRRELANNAQQRTSSLYARFFRNSATRAMVPLDGLSDWVKDPALRQRHQEAMMRSDVEAMLNYYRANFPREPYQEDVESPCLVTAPTLVIHGLNDTYFVAETLSGLWKWMAADLTIMTIPGAGHFVQHDVANMVNRTVLGWLNR